ncbi:hypothetical protein BD410DRAFT_785906 [Rickenella mellea]|uniref:Uncharacterized protein n=1 Tax=Rickenella mellea TaxID=50990 RepID=A0A4Y7QC83_9AGAM|nr:hypothetical protein BD410DRAFT_785906 [Rickenella mellea]
MISSIRTFELVSKSNYHIVSHPFQKTLCYLATCRLSVYESAGMLASPNIEQATSMFTYLAPKSHHLMWNPPSDRQPRPMQFYMHYQLPHPAMATQLSNHSSAVVQSLRPIDRHSLTWFHGEFQTERKIFDIRCRRSNTIFVTLKHSVTNSGH